jgi:hypothetical protein
MGEGQADHIIYSAEKTVYSHHVPHTLSNFFLSFFGFSFLFCHSNLPSNTRFCVGWVYFLALERRGGIVSRPDISSLGGWNSEDSRSG